MSSYNEEVQEDVARFSADLFGPSIPANYEQNYPPNIPPNYPPNYQRRDQILDLNYQQPPQMSAPAYTSTDPNVFIPQGAFQPTTSYAYGGTSSVSSSHFTAPISSTPSTDVPEIQEADVSPSTDAPTPLQGSQQPVKKTKRAPEYNQWWLAWYKVTKDEDDILKTLDCKVPNCKKPYFVYKQTSGMTSFKRHVEMHQKKGEVPSENAEPR